ncbi:hypothetical protein OV079_03425 [Nannocystis pusilla]|uniref:Uncharacterized protein n=1 Tax=Nannocystis pusilla TaxID=889268 RepID=A0A9X3EK34_9BACT|nr:hypothetical protein [Nannocystis pusilla]MCY1004635.1 hypothetical protein [Nannocystis pusilla]
MPGAAPARLRSVHSTQAPMTDLFFIAVVLASFAAFWGFMRLVGRL